MAAKSKSKLRYRTPTARGRHFRYRARPASKSRTKRVDTRTGRGLTVAPDKTAVLLRLPRSSIKLIDKEASKRGLNRTDILYERLAVYPEFQALAKNGSQAKADAGPEMKS